MNIALWTAQLLLAVFFAMAGFNHGLKPLDEAVKSSPWILGISPALARFIGWSEMIGALGLLLPAALRIAPWLTPVAAVGLATIMALAIPFHLLRGESHVIGMHIVVGAMALFVAWGRFRRAPIRPR